MGAKENKVTSEIFINLPPDTIAFRNHVGKVQDKRGQWHTFGLYLGSADLIGLTEIKITPDMVDKKIAVFTSIEVKTETGKVSKEQRVWGKVVKQRNAFHVVARSPQDVKDALEEFIRKLEGKDK